MPRGPDAPTEQRYPGDVKVGPERRLEGNEVLHPGHTGTVGQAQKNPELEALRAAREFGVAFSHSFGYQNAAEMERTIGDFVRVVSQEKLVNSMMSGLADGLGTRDIVKLNHEGGGASNGAFSDSYDFINPRMPVGLRIRIDGAIDAASSKLEPRVTLSGFNRATGEESRISADAAIRMLAGK